MSKSVGFREALAFRAIVAGTVRSLMPLMPSWQTILLPSIDAITDEMIAAGNLPDPVIEAIHDFGHYLVRAAEEMFAARARIGRG